VSADDPTEHRLLDVTDLVKHFPRRGGAMRAVDGVTFALDRGETLALVGESGCGKSTVARSVLRLTEPSSGSVVFDGTPVLTARRDDLRRLRRQMQMVFQDPYASLDPRMSVMSLLREPLVIHRLGTRTEQTVKIESLMRRVGLDPASAARRPRAFSGGQRQRIAIARALILEPALLVCDEPVSSLDVSIQAQVLNLFVDLQQELRLAYLFISHDLAVVNQIADRVAVMYLGRIVEFAARTQLFDTPRHPYTVALLSAIPDPNEQARRERIVLRGELPSASAPPSGCRFRTRCWKAEAVCHQVEPPLAPRRVGHLVACHFPESG
jgi:oligopeptide transport system ATP-binding protein